MRKNRGKGGFTILEMLIVVAIIAILIGICLPLYAKYLERTREIADLANVRAAYSEVLIASMQEDAALYDPIKQVYTKTVELVQRKNGWSIETEKLNIGGILESDTKHWKGKPKVDGCCVVTYDPKTDEVQIVWDGYYSVYINYQWKEDAYGRISVSAGSYDSKNWPASAVPEFIDAINNSGQKVVVDQITDNYPNLKKWLNTGGGYEIGVFIADTEGRVLYDTGGQYLSADSTREFEIATTAAAENENVKVAIQFFKMRSGTNHGRGSVELTEAEARELEKIFSIE